MEDTEALNSRASKIARARELRLDGKLHREIADVLLLTLCKRCHDAFHKAAGGAVRMAIGPFFSNTNQVREFSASSEYPVAV